MPCEWSAVTIVRVLNGSVIFSTTLIFHFSLGQYVTGVGVRDLITVLTYMFSQGRKEGRKTHSGCVVSCDMNWVKLSREHEVDTWTWGCYMNMRLLHEHEVVTWIWGCYMKWVNDILRKVTSTALSSSSTSCVAFLAQPSWCAFRSTKACQPLISTTLSTRALSTNSTKPSSLSPKSSTALAVISAKVGSLFVSLSTSNLKHIYYFRWFDQNYGWGVRILQPLSMPHL